MQKIPQFVRERLKTEAATVHPDANVLTAFTERSLPERDRAGVLMHLATCRDCRETVALALPETPSAETPSITVGRGWVSWPAFRWAFAAAGVALIVLGAVEFERRDYSARSVARQVAPAAVGLSPQAQSLPQSSANTASELPAPAASRRFTANEKLAKKDIPKLPLHAPAESREQGGVRLGASAAPPAAGQAPASSSPSPSMTEMVAVQAQNEAVQPESASEQAAGAPVPNFASRASSYNSAPLSRAKPADTQFIKSAALDALSGRARWSITAVGGLQRSMDQGNTWQGVDVDRSGMGGGVSDVAIGGPLKSMAKQSSIQGATLKSAAVPTFFRTVTADGNEVWAGGSNAALFHSVDGGDHWTRILPSASGLVLTGDVLSVEFPDPGHGTVTTSTPETWVTSDGGQSWTKQ